MSTPRALTVVLMAAATWLSQCNADTPRLNQAVATIQSQVQTLIKSSRKQSPDFFRAVATMNFVQSRLSSLTYSQLTKANRQLPANTEQCLEMGAGICGNHVRAFRDIAGRLGMRARPVEFYLHGETPEKNSNHIAVEVFYKGQWRFFDITWGTYFRRPQADLDDLLSWHQVQQAPQVRKWAVTNQSDLWYQQWRAAGLDPLTYLDAERKDVLLGRGGVIRISGTADPDRKGQLFTPRHQPNYIGRNESSADFGSLRLQLEANLDAARTLVLEVAGVAGTGRLEIQSQQGTVTRDLQTIQPGSLEIPLADIAKGKSLLLKITTQQQRVGYLVFKRIKVR